MITVEVLHEGLDGRGSKRGGLWDGLLLDSAWIRYAAAYKEVLNSWAVVRRLASFFFPLDSAWTSVGRLI